MWQWLRNLPSPEISGAILRLNVSDAVITDLFNPLDVPSAEEFPCPFPGGEGCPRQVRQLPDETWVAVCGRYPQKCHEVIPDSIDTAIYSLNLIRVAEKLANEWRKYQITANASLVSGDLNIVQIGFYNPRGSLKYPLFLHIPYFDGDRSKAIELISQNYEHFILIIPSTENVAPANIEALKKRGSLMLGLINSDVATGLDDFKKLHPSLSSEGTAKFKTPPDAAWKDITITFIARDTVSIKCGKEPAANYERVQIPGMFVANEDYKKPSDKWFLLMAFAQMGPYLSREDLDKIFLGKTNRKAQDQQKSQLSKVLKNFFGIESEPIPYCRKEKLYKPQLIITRLNCDLTPWIAEMHK